MYRRCNESDGERIERINFIYSLIKKMRSEKKRERKIQEMSSTVIAPLLHRIFK